MATVPACECECAPYWIRKRAEHSRATLNNTTLDWEEEYSNGHDEFECGECGQSASEDNDEKLQGLHI